MNDYLLRLSLNVSNLLVVIYNLIGGAGIMWVHSLRVTLIDPLF